MRSRQHTQKSMLEWVYPPWPCILMAPRCGSILPSFACPGGARRLADLLSYRAARNRARVSIQRQLATICRRGRRIRPAVCRRVGRPALPISLPCCHGARQGRRFPVSGSIQPSAGAHPILACLGFRIGSRARHGAARHLYAYRHAKDRFGPSQNPGRGTGTGPHLAYQGALTQAQADALDLSLIVRFANSALAGRILSARQVLREQPFVVRVPAHIISPAYPSDETTLLQGILDLAFEEKDGWVLVDYKTDRIPPEGRRRLSRDTRGSYMLTALPFRI